MATHWLPYMASAPYVVIDFLPSSVPDRRAQLRVNPPPELMLRVFMLFCPVTHQIPGMRVTRDASDAAAAVACAGRPRPSWTVVEWGGMECALVPARTLSPSEHEMPTGT
jgi:hypothetical protein